MLKGGTYTILKWPLLLVPLSGPHVQAGYRPRASRPQTTKPNQAMKTCVMAIEADGAPAACGGRAARLAPGISLADGRRWKTMVVISNPRAGVPPGLGDYKYQELMAHLVEGRALCRDTKRERAVRRCNSGS